MGSRRDFLKIISGASAYSIMPHSLESVAAQTPSQASNNLSKDFINKVTKSPEIFYDEQLKESMRIYRGDSHPVGDIRVGLTNEPVNAAFSIYSNEKGKFNGYAGNSLRLTIVKDRQQDGSQEWETLRDTDLDGRVDVFYVTRVPPRNTDNRRAQEGPRIDVKTLPEEQRQQLQARYDAKMKELNVEAERRLSQYLGTSKK